MTTQYNLRIPFSWEERKSLVQDRFWFVPQRIDYKSYTFPGWEHIDFFLNKAPICVEYCSGNGHWILEKAVENPDKNWVAVEKRFDRAKKIWLKVKKQNIPNLVVVWAEANGWTSNYIPAASVDEIFINFPDPWPKRKHMKNRLLTPEFVHEMVRILKEQRTITFVTDHEGYSEIAIEELLASPNLKSTIDSPYYKEPTREYGTSFFEDLFRRQGKTIRLHNFIKESTS